jgi:histidinol-phosphate aminotransferase
MPHDIYQLATPGVRRLQPYEPGKPVEDLERELGLSNVIKLASNENPLGPSPKGLEAARAALETVHLYPDGAGFELRGRLADKYQVAPEQITLGNGSNDVLDMVARAFLMPSHNAVFSQHAFAVYPIVTSAAGAQAKVAPARPPDDPQPYGHDLQAMAQQVDRDTRILFVANPNNPTGTWLTREALKSFLASLPDHVVVVLDEAYFEYVNLPDYPDGMALMGEFPNLVVTRTFSKIYGLAGLRCGYAVSSPEIADLLNRVRHPFNVNSAALAAAAAALTDNEFLAKSATMNRAGLVQLGQAFDAMGLRWLPSVANFICVDVDRAGGDVYEELLREGVIVRPLANYQLPSHLRITVGASSENARLLDALARALPR